MYKLGDDQLANMWEGSFNEDPTLGELKMRIESVDFGNQTLTAEQLPVGEHYYKEISFEHSLTITLRESCRGAVRSGFKAWWDQIYDMEKHVFRVLDNEEDILKTFTLKFLGKNTENFLQRYIGRKKENLESLGSSFSGLLDRSDSDETEFPEIYTFTFKRCRLTSFSDPVSLSYDDEAPVRWQVSMVFDIPEEENLNSGGTNGFNIFSIL